MKMYSWVHRSSTRVFRAASALGSERLRGERDETADLCLGRPSQCSNGRALRRRATGAARQRAGVGVDHAGARVDSRRQGSRRRVRVARARARRLRRRRVPPQCSAPPIPTRKATTRRASRRRTSRRARTAAGCSPNTTIAIAARAPDLRGRGRRASPTRRSMPRRGAASSPGRSASWRGSCSTSPRTRSRRIMPGLSSDVIACVVKLMSNDELIAVGRKVFNPLPGIEHRRAGATWARASSPTRRPTIPRTSSCRCSTAGRTPSATSCSAPTRCRATSIRWPRSSWRCAICWRPSISRTVLPHCVLAHIDVQAQVENEVPGIDRARGSRASPASPTPTRCSTSTSRRCARTRRRAPGATACTSRRARAPTRPTATARASTW